MLQKLYVFFRKETVLSIAVILALLSMFWVRPDKAYFTYIDFRTLGLLFCLMAIVAGLKAVGVFDILAQKLLMGTSGTVGVMRLLVLLCFFLSMVITNDVALITFVPLALIIVHKLPKELGNYWLLKIVAMQTIAANLGSMLTPIGNPQNLYLYARAGMSAAGLIALMLPYSATALILLLIWIQVAAAKAPHVCGSEKDKTLLGFSDRKELNMEYLAAYLILFAICLLTVARIIPYQIPLVLVLIYMLPFRFSILWICSIGSIAPMTASRTRSSCSTSDDPLNCPKKVRDVSAEEIVYGSSRNRIRLEYGRPYAASSSPDCNAIVIVSPSRIVFTSIRSSFGVPFQ